MGRVVKSRLLVIGVAACAGAVAGSAAHAQLLCVQSGGPSGLQGNAVYFAPMGTPVLVGGGAGMRIAQAQDQIDSISRNALEPTDFFGEFPFWFSVDDGSIGLPPDSFMDFLPPFTVTDQAANRQHPADIFMTTEGFERVNGLIVGGPSLGLFNNALVVNQSQQYPRTWGLLPAANPQTTVPAGVGRDEVVGASRGFPPAPGQMLYFSLTAGSPSLPLVVPGVVPSGANIFVDTDINAPGTEQLYAQFNQLGLAVEDDINAMVVLDQGMPGHYDLDDEVYFTLTPGSPSLLLFGGSGANVLLSRFGVVSLFAEGTIMGLSPGDQIDALDVVPMVNDSVLETIESEVGGIFLCEADLTTSAVPSTPGYGVPNGVVNNEDFFFYLSQFAAGNRFVADMTTGAIPGAPGYGIPDGLITNQDFFYFLAQFAEGC
ncbi:MAG: GC-type dockerin domain-anchored protein [Phycisphaerales bacterium]